MRLFVAVTVTATATHAEPSAGIATVAELKSRSALVALLLLLVLEIRSSQYMAVRLSRRQYIGYMYLEWGFIKAIRKIFETSNTYILVSEKIKIVLSHKSFVICTTVLCAIKNVGCCNYVPHS